MSVYVECKPDEMTAVTLGVSPRGVEHATGIGGVLTQLAKRNGITGMVDEDPGAQRPSYFRRFVETSREHNVLLLCDEQRNNRLVVICPRLEDWLVTTTKAAGMKMSEFGFDSDNGVRLHSEINQRLNSLRRLLEALLAAKCARLTRLQSLLLLRS